MDLVVLVKDQKGNPLEGIKVTCTVKESGESCGKGEAMLENMPVRLYGTLRFSNFKNLEQSSLISTLKTFTETTDEDGKVTFQVFPGIEVIIEAKGKAIKE